MMTSWKMALYGVDGPQELGLENLKSMVRLKSEEEPDVEINESIMEFFRESVLDDLRIENRNITLTRRNVSETYELVDLDDFDNLTENNSVMTLPVLLNEDSQRVRRTLETLLGDHWLVEHLGGYAVISRYGEPKMALLRL
jgi:hypothetical protein